MRGADLGPRATKKQLEEMTAKFRAASEGEEACLTGYHPSLNTSILFTDRSITYEQAMGMGKRNMSHLSSFATGTGTLTRAWHVELHSARSVNDGLLLPGGMNTHVYPCKGSPIH